MQNGDGTPEDDEGAKNGTLGRRSLLTTLAAAGLAGCQGMLGDEGEPTAMETATDEPTPTPTPHPNGTPASVPAGWPDVRDDYYGSLATTLGREMGLPGGEFVYGDTEAEALSAYRVQSDAGTAEPLDVSGDDVPFSAAARVEVTEETENAWNVTMKATVQDRDVSEGDLLLGVLYLRGPEESENQPTLRYVSKDEANESTNMVRGVEDMQPVDEWIRYYVPIQFDYDSEAGAWWTEFFLGFGPQTIDVGGLALIDFDKNVSLSNLPSGPATEPTSDDDGDWEAAADERIADHRTSELTVEVTDAEGSPVVATDVEVAMQEHEFGFGTGVDAKHLLEETEQGDPYRENVKDLFNTATLTNHHKWRFWQDEEFISDGATEWLRGRGIDVRGHAALWADVSGWAVPEDVVRAMGRTWEDAGVTDPDLDPEYVREQTMAHVETVIEDYGDDLIEWEVLNEVIHQPGFVKAVNGIAATDDTTMEDPDPVEAPILREWFSAAREAAPDGMPLGINDYNVFVGPYESERSRYERQIQYLNDGDAGLDFVGLQCHFSQSETLTPEEIMSGLDRYAQYDVDLRITEFDMADEGWNEENKGTFFHRFLKTVFSHPAVEEFLVWGIYSPTHWQGDAPFFTEGWGEKAPLEAYRDLVFDEWWTEKTGATDTNGAYSTTGFKGEYEVTAVVDGQEVTETVTLGDDPATVELSPE
ncbi:endo-1,4-beta-xylanase [Halosimplex salinum]|uniref:endo-1,4-beta-xylanase n=1 Tax=Halosimplex salinum TaxID=1710538 RepID=UPI000F49D63B|nr:endo-1,4-beta-xylanase [Halosimplex salinum]